MRIDYVQLGDQLKKVPVPPPPTLPHRRAVVMLLLSDHPETSLLVIRKTDTEGYDWRGHLALPGGRLCDADHTPLHAALRELNEELNVPPTDVEVLGELGHFQTTHSGDDLHVHVGHWIRRGPLHPDPKEVAEVLEIDLADLIEQHRAHRESQRPSRTMIEVRYGWNGMTIWGVTARIVCSFLELIS